MKHVIKKITPEHIDIETAIPGGEQKRRVKHEAFFKEVLAVTFTPTEKDISNFYDNLMEDDNTLITMVSKYLDAYPDTIHIDPKAKQVLTNT